MFSDLLNIFNSSPDLYLVLAPDLTVQAATDAYLKATYRNRDAILKKSVFDVLSEEFYGYEATGVADLKASLLTVIETENPNEIRLKGYNMDNSGYVSYKKKYWNFNNVPVFDENNEVKYIILKVTDITKIVEEEKEVKRSHESISEETERLKEAQAIGHIGSFDWKYPLDYIQLSDELYNIYGLPPQHEKLSIEKLLSFTYLEDVALFKSAIEKIIHNQQPFDLTIRIVKLDNVIRYARCIAKAQKKNDFFRIYGTIQDITEQILAEQKIVSSEDMLKRAEALGNMGSYEADLDLMTFQMSDQLYRILGYEPGAFEPNLDIIDSISHPDDTQKVRDILQEARITKKPYHYFRRVFKPNGQMVHLSSFGYFIRDVNSKTGKFIGIVQDITNQINTDLILDTINEVCFELDHELRIVYANKRAYEFWNKKREDIIGKHFWIAYPEDSNKEFLDIIKNASNNKKQVVTEVWLPLESKWVLLKVNQSTTGLIVLHIDVTEQLKAKEEINRQRQHFKSLVDNIPDVVTRWDKDLNLIYSNKALNASDELFLESIIGKTPVEMGVQKTWRQEFHEATEMKEPRELFSANKTPSGMSYFFSRIVPETEEDGTVKSILSISRDVTQLREAENKLRENHELLMSIFHASPNSICLFKIIYSDQNEVEDFEILMLNDFTETIVGDVSPIGKRYSQLFPKVIETGIFDEFKLTAITGKPGNFEKWYSGEGMKHWFRFKVSKLRDMLIVNTEDITARKQVEEQLKDSNDLLQSVFNASTNSISVYQPVKDHTGKIIDFEWILSNKQVQQHYGEGDLSGKRLIEIVPNEMHVQFLNHFTKALETQQSQDFELYYNYEDIEKWYRVIAVKLHDKIVASSEDITNRKLAEQRLQNSNDLLQSIFDSSIVGLNFYKAIRNDQGEIIDFRVVIMSHLSENIINVADTTGKKLLELVPWIRETGLFERFKEVVNDNLVLDQEEKLGGLGGDLKWIWRRAVKLDDGLVTGWLDITEKKQTEFKLSESNLFIQQVTDSIPDIVYVYDLEKRDIVYINRESFKSVEYLKDYIYNLSPNVKNVIIHESDAGKRINHNLNLESLTENESREVEFRIKGPDNEWQWFRVRDSLLKRNEDGSARQILGLCQNITKQKKSEEELNKHYEILKQAEEVASIGSWEYDLGQNKMLWSDGMYELFELDHDTAPFLEIYLDYVVLKDRYKMREFIHKIRSGFNPQEDEVTISVGGKHKIFRLKAAVINNQEGKPVKILGVDMDITGKRTAEIKLQILEEQRQKDILDVVMETQEEERRRIAETLHNEFGQLLTAAKLKISTDSVEATKLLNTAIRSVKTISYELMPPILQDFGLKTALNDLFQVKFADANIHYSAKIIGLEKRLDRVHELAVFRVIQEVTNNIVKHSEATIVTINITREAQIVSINIADNGLGLDIKKANQSKKGFGLKYITNRTHLLKGKVEINSEKDHGTRFVIELPLI